MARPSPVEQMEALRAVQVTTALLGESTQDIVNTRRVAALLVSMETNRVLSAVLGSLSERIGAPIVAAIEED